MPLFDTSLNRDHNGHGRRWVGTGKAGPKRTILFMLSVLPIVSAGLLQASEWRTYGFYRARFSRTRATLFNPNGIATAFLDEPQTSWHFSQLLDVRMRWLTLDWKLAVMEEIEVNGSVGDRLDFKECFFQRSIFKNGLFVIGRSIQRWGTGYAFNPTDAVAPEKTLSDPENTEQSAAGNDMASVEFFWENSSLACCYLTRLHLGSTWRKEGSRLALRYYRNVLNFDLSFIARFHEDRSPLWGFNFSTVMGERIEIHGEIGLENTRSRPVHRVVRDGVMLYTSDPFVRPPEDADRVFVSLLFGFQATLPGNILWISEYFHQDQGYSKREWKDVIAQAAFQNALLGTVAGELAEANVLWSLNVFASGGAMRDYLMQHIETTQMRRLVFRATCLINVNDGSTIFIPEIRGRLNEQLILYSRGQFFFGAENTEFGAMFQASILEGGIRSRF